MGAWSCYAIDLGQKATLREWSRYAMLLWSRYANASTEYPKLFRFFPIPDSRLPIPDSRFPILNSKF
ncbi:MULTISPECIES: hypothetical protein [unclassified Moorena]|uniref:hypothetical protein n=1 Tax=unclassified Moorena TaxID=2683338 RepID=UPI0013CD38FC|nr:MULTISPECIES: hypothetical protein [unclassified Moorena]NEO21303.1 hypothetical protein [Moorena sp. SIO4A5]NEQ62012.1 hypothetical protein [Moorena sp. SIO4A1]